MLIGIDARKLRDGGIGTYVRHLVEALLAEPRDHRFALFLDPRDFGTTTWSDRVTREIAVRAGKYSLAEHWVLAAAARAARVDLFHAPHYTLPLAWHGPAVVTIHDLIHVRFPQFFPAGAALYARTIAGMAARRSRVVIANSQHTRQDIIEALDVPPENVRVIPLGVSAGLARRDPALVAAFRSARALPEDYLLYVGARRGHKNLGLLLRAVATIPTTERPPLVLSGGAWRPNDPLARLAEHLGIAAQIHFAGDFDDDDALSCCYSGAALYVQPSLTEGFGLPPLEAMACGVPVLCSTGGALPETVGDAAELLAPLNPEAWAQAIVALLADSSRRAELTRRGIARARGFTWPEAARRTLEVYEAATAR